MRDYWGWVLTTEITGRLVAVCCLAAAVAFVGFAGASTATTSPTAGTDTAVTINESDPVAEAGLDQTVKERATVYLSAVRSFAREGNLTSYEWQIEAPNGTAMQPADPHSIQTRFKAAQTGTYAVTLTVTDEAGRTSSDTMYVEVEPHDAPDVSLFGPNAVAIDDSAVIGLQARAGDAALQSITWLVNDEQEDAAFVDGQRERDVLVLDASTDLGLGIHEIEVIVADDAGMLTRETHTIEVVDPEFEVDILPHDEVAVGETVTPTLTVTNPSPVRYTERVRLQVDGETVHSHWLTVPAETSIEFGPDSPYTLDWETDDADPGQYSLCGVTSADRDCTTIEVVEPAYFEITAFDTSHVDDDGDSLTVEAAEITNTGGAADTQDIELQVDGRDAVAIADDLYLSSGESATVSGTLDGGSGLAGGGPDRTQVVTLASEDDARSISISQEPRCDRLRYEGVFDGPEEIEIGQEVTVSVTGVEIWPSKGPEEPASFQDGCQPERTGGVLSVGEFNDISGNGLWVEEGFATEETRIEPQNVQIGDDVGSTGNVRSLGVGVAEVKPRPTHEGETVSVYFYHDSDGPTTGKPVVIYEYDVPERNDDHPDPGE